jgi:RNA polymerase sigma factor (sigma-70 family)
MTVDDNTTLARQAIAKAYVERKTGFLAWAKHHAPDYETAEDALQDAFIRAITNGNAFQVVEDAAAWIFSTLRNRLVDLWRGRDARRRAGAVDLSPEILEEVAVAAGLGPEAELLRDGLDEALQTAMAALPTEQREVLLAQAIDGITFKELAGKTGVPIDTLMARKRRAVRKLAAALAYWMED